MNSCDSILPSSNDKELISVSERKAFFERLTSFDLLEISHNSLPTKKAKLGSESKENFKPIGFFNFRSNSVLKDPPAKPRRTFAHSQELLKQQNLDNNSSKYDGILFKTSSTKGNRRNCSNNSANSLYPNILGTKNEDLKSFIGKQNSIPPPLPPKPSLSPDIPRGSQLPNELNRHSHSRSYNSSSLSYRNCGRTNLIRHYSDESLYATPPSAGTSQLSSRQEVKEIGLRSFSAINERKSTQKSSGMSQMLPKMTQEVSSYQNAQNHRGLANSHPRLKRAVPIIRRQIDRNRPISAYVLPTNNDRRLTHNDVSDESSSTSSSQANIDVDEIKLKRKVTRANLVHRRTLALYNEQLNAFCRRMTPQLFDRALIVRLVPRNRLSVSNYDTVTSEYVPVIAYKYPEMGQPLQSSSSTVDFADLFIPDFTHAKSYSKSDRWPKNEEFILTLTDEVGKRSFAYCIRHLLQRRKNSLDSDLFCNGLSEVFVLISPIHAPSFYMSLARECVCYLEEGLGVLKNLLDAVFRRSFPANGGVLWVAEIKGPARRREIMIRTQNVGLGRADCSFVVQRLGIETTVAIIASLLAEQRVLIGGDSVQSVSHAVQSLVSLLQPFSWPYTLVPVIPDTLLELANSPTPYLLGVLRNNLYKLKDLIVIDTNNNRGENDDAIIIDLDGGIFVPQLSQVGVASENSDFKEKSALALCEKLLFPKKLAKNLMSSFKEALNGGPGPNADELLQKTMLNWFASLLGHYKFCGFHSVYSQDMYEDTKRFQTCATQLVTTHTSKSARRFTEWFVQTGIFRDWMRRKITYGASSKYISYSEENANKLFDELSLQSSAPSNVQQNKLINIFSKAQSAILRSNLLKRF